MFAAGVWTALRYYCDTLKHGAHYALYDRAWDRLERHRTGGSILVSEDDTVGRAKNLEERRYQASARLPFIWTVRALRIDPTRYSFVDYGSGRGRMLLTTARFPFKRVIGIEFSRTPHQHAHENIASYPKDRLACSDINSLNLNAIDFDLPEGDCLLFFFNPFTGEVLEQVAQRIEESQKRTPRSIVVAFMNSNRVPLFANRPSFQPLQLPVLELARLRLLSPWPLETFVVNVRAETSHEART